MISTEEVKSNDSVQWVHINLETDLWKFSIISNEQEYFACLTPQAIKSLNRVMNHTWMQDGNNYSAKQITSIQTSQTEASITMHLYMLFYIKDQHNTQNIMENKHNFNIPPTLFGQSGPSSYRTHKIQSRRYLRSTWRTKVLNQLIYLKV